MSLDSRSFARNVLAFALAGALLPLAAVAQTAKPEQAGVSTARLARVSELVDRNIQAGEISGAVTLVARNGRVVWLQAQGVSDLEKKTPMQKDTLFRVASMSKPVAGVAILMLAEEGKIRLSDPLSKFLPAFKDVKVNISRPPAPPIALPGPGAGPPQPQVFLEPAAREVTILDVLTHTSGIMSGPVSNAAGGPISATRHEAGLKWTEQLPTLPLEFQPGTRWSYSALAGFDLLSHLVEIVSGQTFDEFVSQRIFKPLGVRETFFWPTPAQRARLVTSYTKTAKGLTPRENPDSMSAENYFSGAGGLMSTAESYARFAMMLANGGELNGARIVSPRTVELMGSAFISDTLPGRSPGESYGLSVRVVTDPVKRLTALSKGSFGWSGAYGTHFFVDPSKHLVGVLMVQTPVNAMRDDFENAVMQAVID